jgi:hypothetical protein
LSRSGSFGIGGVAYDTSSSRLLGRIVVPHIVMRIQDSVGALGDSYIVDSFFVEAIVLEK